MITLILIFVGQWFFIFKSSPTRSNSDAARASSTRPFEFANKYIGTRCSMSISFIVTFVYVVVAAVVSPSSSRSSARSATTTSCGTG